MYRDIFYLFFNFASSLKLDDTLLSDVEAVINYKTKILMTGHCVCNQMFHLENILTKW